MILEPIYERDFRWDVSDSAAQFAQGTMKFKAFLYDVGPSKEEKQNTTYGK